MTFLGGRYTMMESHSVLHRINKDLNSFESEDVGSCTGLTIDMARGAAT